MTQFKTAIQEAAHFTVPEMNSGTSYLYDIVYCRLINGEEVLLSDFDFDAFDSEDIHSFSDLYDNMFGKNNHQADSIINTLRQVAPVCEAVAYV